jgi:hypothetical protein
MPLFIEVKPALTYLEYAEPKVKIQIGLAAFDHDVLIVGASPFVNFADAVVGRISAGLLGEGGWGELGGLPVRLWDDGCWHQCTICNLISVHHAMQSYKSRICGHYDGGGNLAEPPIALMKQLWADACNDVKWKGTAL